MTYLGKSGGENVVTACLPPFLCTRVVIALVLVSALCSKSCWEKAPVESHAASQAVTSM